MAAIEPGRSIVINGRTICLVQGDISDQRCDAIVNAANSQLQLGSGVAGAIRQKGGPSIQLECDRIGGTPVGTAVLTTSGRLKAESVIHAVGPMMGEGDEDVKLTGATRSSLKIAENNRMKSICFPAISTGIFGFPVKAAARIMLQESISHLKTETSLETIIFCLFNQNDYKVFDSELQRQVGVEA